MTKADLHLHSKYSDYPGTLLLKAYNSPESFTEPETLYQQAKARGMDWVTITDHDDIRGCLELVRNHPRDCFISCEVTAYFPEDDCKAHILVYDINQQQYDHMMAVRRNIYRLRDYIIKHNIAHSVAHATHDQDGKLSFEHIEKLVLLFDCFEVINGGAAELGSRLLAQYIDSLDEDQITILSKKHVITPNANAPWIKGYTGGSDDHCGLLIGTAFTQSKLNSSTPHTLDVFLHALRARQCSAQGLHGNFEIYATGVFKHIHDFRLARDSKYKKTKMNDFLEMFFAGNEGNWAKRFKKSQSLRYLKRKNSKTHRALHKVLNQVSNEAQQDITDKIPATFDNISLLHDEMFRTVISVFTKHLPNGNIFKSFNHLATLFPMTLMAAPFVGSLRHQALKSSIKEGLLSQGQHSSAETALWFTDTIDDLNGVSVTLRQIAEYSHQHNYQLKLVTCVDEQSLKEPLPNNTINVPPVSVVTVPGYETQSIGFPSMLSLMKRIFNEQPDQIIISTPGPLGLGALMCAKLMNLPVKMIYHTDFAEQLLRISQQTELARFTDMAVSHIYKMADKVFVPSKAYIDKLINVGLHPDKLAIFPRGLNLDLYCPIKTTSDNSMHPCYKPIKRLQGNFTLLFAGRISQDKNISLLISIINHLEQDHPGHYNLVIAGDGPGLASLKEQLSSLNNVLFTGRVDAAQLVQCYQNSDLLVFPSHSDTFGMVVLEALACGLPAIVTASGGPKEIIVHQKTGHIIETDLVEDWTSMIHHYNDLKHIHPEQFQELKTHCAEHAHRHNDWQPVFDAVLGNRYLQNGSPSILHPLSSNSMPEKNIQKNIIAA